jgi:hypothetical protein
VQWTGSEFVAVGEGMEWDRWSLPFPWVCGTSVDGSEWSWHFSEALNGYRGLSGVTRFGTRYYATSYSLPTIVSSSNAAYWQQRLDFSPYPCTYSMGTIRSSESLIVTVGRWCVNVSSDGTNWRSIELGSEAELNDMAFGDGQLVAVGENGVIYTSP